MLQFQSHPLQVSGACRLGTTNVCPGVTCPMSRQAGQRPRPRRCAKPVRLPPRWNRRCSPSRHGSPRSHFQHMGIQPLLIAPGTPSDCPVRCREGGTVRETVRRSPGSQGPLTSRPSGCGQEERLFPRSPQADRGSPGRTHPTTCSVDGRAPNRRQRLSILRRGPGDRRRHTRSS